MEIKWGNVFLALIIVYVLINLPSILNNIAAAVSSITGALSSAFGSITTNHDSPAYDLVRLCVLLIFVLGVIRLLKKRKH